MKAPAYRTKAFVLLDGQLYSAGAQRMADAYGGHRTEPALAGKGIHLYCATRFEDGQVEFGRATCAVFDESGNVHEGIRHWNLLALMDGLPQGELVKQKLPDDPRAQQFIDLLALDVSQQHLERLLETARTLPTR